MELELKHSESPPPKPSINEALKQELKTLPPYLSYVYLGRDNTLPVIIAECFNERQVEGLVAVLKRFKRAIGWIIKDIIWIPPVFVPIKSNSCPITTQVLSTKEGLINAFKR